MLRQRIWYYNYSSHNDWDGNNPTSKMPNEWYNSQQNEQYKLGNRVITNITLTNTIFAYINFQTRDCMKFSFLFWNKIFQKHKTSTLSFVSFFTIIHLFIFHFSEECTCATDIAVAVILTFVILGCCIVGGVIFYRKHRKKYGHNSNGKY